tara:strand:- start:3364 stop:3672 length:309 start_codon:yes stop_codon:yes gene_type:complete
MLTLIDCSLTEPPSSTTCFRDITLYTSFILNSEVLLECERDYRDIYYKWLKEKYAWDYVADIVSPGRELGITIRPKKGSITVNKIYYDNLSEIIARLKNLHN